VGFAVKGTKQLFSEYKNTVSFEKDGQSPRPTEFPFK